MSSIQRSFNTLQYYTGTQNGVLIINPAIEGLVIERFLLCTLSIHMYVHGDEGIFLIYARKYVHMYVNLLYIC